MKYFHLKTQRDVLYQNCHFIKVSLLLNEWNLLKKTEKRSISQERNTLHCR